MNSPSYLQYGCGMSAPKRWRNFDSSPTLRFERLPIVGGIYTKNTTRFPANVEYGDIVKGLPVSAGTCCAIYCSHVLEHLSLSDCKTALHNTQKLLRPGGIFRLVMPDLEYLARQYLAQATPQAAHDFMTNAHLGQTTRSRGLAGALVAWLGNSLHLWMWDYQSLVPELTAAGFRGIRRASFGDSTDALFGDVEERGRWDNCLGVECRAPDGMAD